MTAPEPHWFEPIAAHLGPAYLRYAFTKGTEQEVDFLVDVLSLHKGDRVLDVGCGPGRHAHALARRGIEAVGVDISERFVELATQTAPHGATFLRGDARALDFTDGFDAAISLCQGGFGLLNGEDGDVVVLERMARALHAGGRLALSAFSAYFRLHHPGDDALHDFDADTGVDHEHTAVKNENGDEKAVELWTTCYTPRELRLLARGVGLDVDHVWSVDPGAYARRAPDLDHAELLLVAHRP